MPISNKIVGDRYRRRDQILDLERMLEKQMAADIPGRLSRLEQVLDYISELSGIQNYEIILQSPGIIEMFKDQIAERFGSETYLATLGALTKYGKMQNIGLAGLDYNTLLGIGQLSPEEKRKGMLMEAFDAYHTDDPYKKAAISINYPELSMGAGMSGGAGTRGSFLSRLFRR